MTVYKIGDKGAITITQDDEITTGIYRTQALKPTGAGDSFMGDLVAGLACGEPVLDAVLQGSAAAAMVVARVGCAPAMRTTQDLEDFLRNKPIEAWSKRITLCILHPMTTRTNR